MTKEICENEELYSSLGRFIIAFTEVEKELTSLLKVLCDERENMWVGLFFIDDLLLGRARDKIWDVARLRLEGDQALLKQLKEILYRRDTEVPVERDPALSVERITKRRNVLIHGDWHVDPTGTSMTKVWDFRLEKKFVDKKKTRYFWQHLHDTPVMPSELRQLTRDSEELAKALKELAGKVEAYLKAEQEHMDKLVGSAGSGMVGQ